MGDELVPVEPNTCRQVTLLPWSAATFSPNRVMTQQLICCVVHMMFWAQYLGIR